jgi:hypothetical protein
MVKDAGADVTHIDMRDFEMLLYDGDDEAQNGIPANAIKLKKILSNTTAYLSHPLSTIARCRRWQTIPSVG